MGAIATLQGLRAFTDLSPAESYKHILLSKVPDYHKQVHGVRLRLHSRVTTILAGQIASLYACHGLIQSSW